MLDAVHDAICRALDEAGIKNEVLRGMCLEVGLEKFSESASPQATPAPLMARLSDAATVKLLKDVAKAMAHRMWHLQPHTEGGKLYQRVEEPQGAPSPDPSDTEMLDWLDTVNRRTNERNGTVYGWKFDINHNRAALSDHNLPAISVREAIRAAMKGQPS